MPASAETIGAILEKIADTITKVDSRAAGRELSRLRKLLLKNLEIEQRGTAAKQRRPPRKETGASSWPDRLLAARVDPGTGEIHCSFESGQTVTFLPGSLGIPTDPQIVLASPDEFGSGLVLIRLDGTREDCGADLILSSTVHASSASSTEGSHLASRVARQLRHYREEGRMTQRAMAEKLEMAPPNYHRLEQGRHTPSTHTLLRISNATGLPLARLVGSTS